MAALIVILGLSFVVSSYITVFSGKTDYELRANWEAKRTIVHVTVGALVVWAAFMAGIYYSQQ